MKWSDNQSTIDFSTWQITGGPVGLMQGGTFAWLLHVDSFLEELNTILLVRSLGFWLVASISVARVMVTLLLLF